MKDLTLIKKPFTGSAELHSYVYQFHRVMVEGNLNLVYEGVVNQTITKAFTALAEKNMGAAKEDFAIKKKVYHVMVECLQNICKHADDVKTIGSDHDVKGSGIFIVGQNDDGYTITTGNMILNDRILDLTEMVTKVNSMNKDEIKEFYKSKIKERPLSGKSGAGLGLIDIVKKTGNGLDIHFENIDKKFSFFIMNSFISKK